MVRTVPTAASATMEAICNPNRSPGEIAGSSIAPIAWAYSTAPAAAATTAWMELLVLGIPWSVHSSALCSRPVLLSTARPEGTHTKFLKIY